MNDRDDLRRRVAMAMSDPELVARMLADVPMYEEHPFPERQTEIWLRCVEETHDIVRRVVIREVER